MRKINVFILTPETAGSIGACSTQDEAIDVVQFAPQGDRDQVAAMVKAWCLETVTLP